MVEQFLDDDSGYVTWLRDHPRGFVVSTDRKPTEWYIVLHRARCIVRDPPRTAEYRRTCAETAEELVAWASETVGIEPKRCGDCHP